MAVQIILDRTDAARIVDALLTAAKAEDSVTGRPLLARRYRVIADHLGDALDATVPAPTDPGTWVSA